MRGESLAHLSADHATRVLFCAQLFDDGRTTAELRRAYLKPLREAVMTAQQSGSAIQSTAANGTQVAFQFFAGWSPAVAASLIAEAYTWAAATDVTAALALIVKPRASSIATFAGVSL